MLECPLCGADNPVTHKSCKVCETALSVEHHLKSSVPIETLDTTRSFISWPVLRFAAIMLVLLSLPWIMMSDLLVTPRRVALSRQGYAVLMANYNKQPDYWRGVKQQTLTAIAGHRSDGDLTKKPLVLDGVGLEALVPLLTDDLGMTQLGESTFSCYPVGTTTHLGFILSKKEKGVWPLKIMLSLEVNLSMDGHIIAQPVRLRRGSRTVPLALAPLYFRDEIEAFSKLQEITGSVRNLALKEHSDHTISVSGELQPIPFR